MAARDLAADYGLESLLRALREAGLRIGVVELARLKHVFDQAPRLNREPSAQQLKTIVRAVVVKDEAAQVLFDRGCDAWLEQADAALAPSPRHFAPQARQQPSAKSRSVLQVIAGLLLFAVALGAVFYIQMPRPVDMGLEEPDVEIPAQYKKSAEIPKQSWIENLRQRKVKIRIPRIEQSSAILLWDGWIKLALAGVSLVFAGLLWRQLRRRRYLPEPQPPPTLKGAPRVFLQSLGSKNPVLLDRGQQDTLVWGIERYIAETPTRRLDIAQTVKLTPRAGGLPELRFEYARFHRELWIWLDEALEEPGLARLADEIETTLGRHGLAVERAVFRGLPK